MRSTGPPPLIAEPKRALPSDFLLRLIGAALAVAVLVGAAFLAARFATDSATLTTARALDATFIEGRSGYSGLQEILAALDDEQRSAVSIFDRDPTQPLWIGLEARAPDANRKVLGDAVVELRMLRGTNHRFWAVPLGGTDVASRAIEITSEVKLTPSGAILPVPSSEMGLRVVGSIDTPSRWKPKAYLWPRAAFANVSDRFHQFGGVLVGIFFGLAAFSTIVALLNRSLTYLLFGAWLVTSLRVAAINGGWDLVWLGIPIGDELNFVFIRVTLAAHVVLTSALFLALFESRFRSNLIPRFIRMVLVAGLALLAVAPWSPHGLFIKTFYTVSAIGMASLCVGILTLLDRSGPASARWYAASFGAMVIGLAGEMLYQSGTVPGIVAVLNAQVGAMISAIAMGVSLAEQMRSDRRARIAARTRELAAVQRVARNYDATPIGLFTLDARMHLRAANASFRQTFAIGDADLADPPSIDDVLGSGAADALRSALRRAGTDTEFLGRRAGKPTWLALRLTLEEDTYEGSVIDISARKTAEARLQHLVDHDELTGALNRRGFRERLRASLATAGVQHPISLAWLEIDRFSAFAAGSGSTTTDQLLCALAARLLGLQGELDVGRIESEFVIACHGCDASAARDAIEGLRESLVTRPVIAGGLAIPVSLSAGVVEIVEDIGVERAMVYGRQACEIARRRGSGRTAVLTAEDRELVGHFESLQIVQSLEKHLDAGRFFLMLQPIVDLHDPQGRLAFEALIRMRDQHGRMVTPDRFIPAAEREGLMPQIDRWMTAQVMDLLDANPAFRERIAHIAINLSGASLNDMGFVDHLVAVLAERPNLAPHLCFEVTETVALQEYTEVAQSLDRLREHGTLIALDDFGNGHTNWHYLSQFQADWLKIDGQLVHAVGTNPNGLTMMQALVDMAHALGMKCVAEWTEDEATVRLMRQMGVDYGQGYAFSRPLPVSEALALRSALTLIQDPAVREAIGSRRDAGSLAPIV